MHYTCSECGGVSHREKNCETEGCSKKGQPLAACACEAPEHLEKLQQADKIKQSEEAETENKEN